MGDEQQQATGSDDAGGQGDHASPGESQRAGAQLDRTGG
jgi:hypothetical protein